MAWKIHDPQLASEARQLGTVVTSLASAVAVLVFVVVCAGSFAYRYSDACEDLETDLARIQGEAAAVVHSAGTPASLTAKDITGILSDTLRYDRLDGDEQDHYSVYDARGSLISEIGSPPEMPVLKIEGPFLPGSANPGKVVVEISYAGIIEDTVQIGLAALGLAALVLLAARGVPMSALRSMIQRLDESQAARSTAEDKMRAHVHELEAAREALQRSTERMQMALESAAESSQAKSQFFASMSHELRTPLNAIIGFSEIMSNSLFGPIGNERYCDYVDLILRSGRHLLSLVNEILDLSKAGAGKLELSDGEVDLGLLARDVLRTMQATADKAKVKLVSDIASNMPCLRADPQRLMQVLLNLVSNAIKFNVENGTVRVQAEYQPADGFKIKVVDTGIGIAQENIP
ncbi:MAG: histidine kinase dimerization/phospho-acceptor domain-containing protein, partial [Alphaproteobacteria bacterium]